MSIWGKILGTAVGLAIGGPLGALAGLAAGHAIDVGAARLGRGERAQVAFTIAAIALAAKMARADGYASADEFAVFERLFQVEAAERANAERFYNLAKRSTEGFESYARQVRSIIGTGSPALEDLVEALLMIAVADGVTREELEYVDRVRREFAIADADFAQRSIFGFSGFAAGIGLGAGMAELNALRHVFDRSAGNPHYQGLFDLFGFYRLDDFPFFFAADFAKADEHLDRRVGFEAQQVFEQGRTGISVATDGDTLDAEDLIGGDTEVRAGLTGAPTGVAPMRVISDLDQTHLTLEGGLELTALDLRRPVELSSHGLVDPETDGGDVGVPPVSRSDREDEIDRFHQSGSFLGQEIALAD